MRTLLVQLDGKLPNVALMRLAHHFRARGDFVELRRNPERLLWDDFDAVYGSTIFKWSTPIVNRLRRAWPSAVIGGTGVDERYGVKPDHIMVYMLIGFWDGPRVTDDDLYRQHKLREFGCRPYPMPYVRNKETIGFQRWVIGAYDKRIPWDRWQSANYDPRKLVVAGCCVG